MKTTCAAGLKNGDIKTYEADTQQAACTAVDMAQTVVEQKRRCNAQSYTFRPEEHAQRELLADQK